MRRSPKTSHYRFCFLAFLLTLFVVDAGPWPWAARNTSAQSSNSYALAGTPSGYSTAIHKSREILETLIAGQKLPGLSVAVACDGNIVWSEGFGFADLENRVPVWPSTKFRIGSISKPLTAAAVAQLYEQGRLDLDAPVQKYVPSFPKKKYEITTRELAGHLAGIRHYRGNEFLLRQHYNSVLEGLKIFENDTLLFPPGTKYSYSSYGFNLVSAVVEGASGEEFLSYIRRHVFDALHMRDTVADHVDSLIWHRVRFYATDENSHLLNAPYVDNSYKWAGGGFLSTAEDLVRFASAHVTGGFLKPKTIELLFTSQRTTSGEATGYGMGWSVKTAEDGRRSVGHGGGSIGGTSYLLLRPESKIAVAILVNITPKQGLALQDRALEIAQLFEP